MEVTPGSALCASMIHSLSSGSLQPGDMLGTQQSGETESALVWGSGNVVSGEDKH